MNMDMDTNINQGPRTNSPSSSHQALLEIIQEKERDLNRIRQAADSAAQDEKLRGRRQLHLLQSNCEHHVQTIKVFEKQIHDLEKDHLKAMQGVEREYIEAAEAHIATMKLRSEGEIRKRLKSEFDEKLDNREKKMEKDFQQAVKNELRDQEVVLCSEFDRVMLEKEHKHDKAIEDLRKDLQAKDGELSNLVRLNEKEQNDLEVHLRREARATHEAELRLQLEGCERRFKSSLCTVEGEKDQMLSELNQMRKDRSQIEVENRDLRWKIDELLGVLQNTETEYSFKAEAMEAKKKSMELNMKELKQKVSNCEASSITMEEECNRELKAMEKQCRSEKKTLAHTVKKLKKELEATKIAKEDIEEIIQEKQTEAQCSKRQLKEKVSALKRECNSLRQEIGVINFEAKSKRRNASTCEDDINEALFEKEREHSISTKRLLQKFDDKRRRDKEAFAEEKQRLSRERDEIKTEKETAELVLEKRQMEFESLRVDFNSLRQRKQVNNDAFRVKNKELKVAIEKLREENMQLKESIGTMRSEMEKLMSSPSTHGTKTEPQHQMHTSEQEDANSIKLQLRELSLENKSIAMERDSLIEISNQLKVELSRFHIDQDRMQAENARSCMERMLKTTQSDQSKTIGDIDVEDLAKNVWANAIQPLQSRKVSF